MISAFRGAFRPALFVLAMATFPAASPSWAKTKPSDVSLPDGFLPISDEEKALTKVPFAEGAPAVVLFEAREYEWFLAGDAYALHLQDWRRVKVLASAGVEDVGDYARILYGDWRIKKVEARTVLADGTIVDAAKNIFQERSESGDQTVRVAFPRVEAGAILDLHISAAADQYWYPAPWTLQESIPVLQSRFILKPPKGLKYRTAAQRLPAEKTRPESIRLPVAGEGMRMAFAWSFENIEALPEEANSAALSDISQTLFVIPEEYRDDNFYLPLARDWKSYSENQKSAWDEWMKKKTSAAAALAKQVTAGKETAADKAEAVRRALKERVRLDYIADWANTDSPDDLLAKGKGTSADVAGTAAAMLRAVGVEAQLAAIRRRGSGLVPAEFPVPSLYDDLLLRIPTDKGPIFFSPAADISVGLLPWDCTDLLAIPYDGKADAPVKIPDFRAADNKSVRITQAKLSAEGALSGESVETYQGVSAEIWRRSLRTKDAEARKESLRNHLQQHMGGAQVTSFEVSNLDDDAKDLVVKTRWEAEHYAAPAGKRLLLNLHLLDRSSAEDWAAATRKLDIDLGRNFEQIEVVSLALPEGSGEATIPAAAAMNAGQVGLYEVSYENSGGKVTARRHMRLEMHRFPAQAYTGLKKWFADIAAADDSPVVLTMK